MCIVTPRVKLLILALVTGGLSIKTITGGNQINSTDQKTRSKTMDKISIPPQNSLLSSSETCPPWTYPDGDQCKCGESPFQIIHCSNTTEVSLLQWNCITYNEDLDITEAGTCIYPCRDNMRHDFNDPLYAPLPGNVSDLIQFMCSAFNRRGTLCGQCIEGYYPITHSFNMSCIECPNGSSNWWKLVLTTLLPLTIFFFVILFLNINVTSSNLHGFVFSVQILVVPPVVRAVLILMTNRPTAKTAMKIFGTIYEMWNLDIYRFYNVEICLLTDTIGSMALDLAFGVYPLLLLIATYFLIRLHDSNFKPIVIIWKPFRAVLAHFRRNWDIKTSVIDAFATFFLLSYVKFLSVSFDLLAPVKVYQLNSTGHLTYSWRLYYDASLPYFGERHLPIAIVAISMMTLFSLLPFLVISLYPFRWFQKVLNSLPIRQHILHTFVDSFHGCFKDGTEPGTYDCRWFASLFLFMRFLLFIIGIATLGPIFYVFISISLAFFSLLLINFQPFKENFTHFSDINTICILLLAMFYVSIMGLSVSEQKNIPVSYFFFVVSAIIAILPLLYITVVNLHWLYIHRKFGLELIRRVIAWRQGYQWQSLE